MLTQSLSSKVEISLTNFHFNLSMSTYNGIIFLVTNILMIWEYEKLLHNEMWAAYESFYHNNEMWAAYESFYHNA